MRNELGGHQIMSNRLFQGIIHQMKDAIDRTIGVVDSTGTIICCSDLGRIGETGMPDIKTVLSASEPKAIDGKTFLAIGVQMHPEAAVFVDGDAGLAQGHSVHVMRSFQMRAMPCSRASSATALATASATDLSCTEGMM